MLDGEARQELEQIVEDRARPLENSQGHLRRNVASLKGDLSELHQELVDFRGDQTIHNHQQLDATRDLRTQLRGLSHEFNAFRQETEGRFDALEARSDATDTRLDGIGTRLDGIGGRLDGIDTQLEGIITALADIRGVLDRMQAP